MDALPVELLHQIASYDKACYKALLGVPLFARSLTPGVIVDYKITFGYNVTIERYSTGLKGLKGLKYISWTLNGNLLGLTDRLLNGHLDTRNGGLMGNDVIKRNVMTLGNVR
jgi:hypothetical protein